MKIHYHGSGGEAEASRLTALKRPGGSAAFVDIHYHGDQAMVAGNPAISKAGQAAFLDIHYHGDQAMLENPSIASKGGQAAFLDIHYHGDQAMGGLARESAERGGISASALMSNMRSGQFRVPGGQAAFLDIHYHGDQATLENPSITGKGGQAAFLDIHYHGDQAMLENPALAGGKGGQAAFLDIHYHGDQAMGGLARESAEDDGDAEGGLISRSSLSTANPSVSAPQVKGPKGGSAAFVDIHYHGKTISDADVKGTPGLHIGNAALLDIHYHG